MSPLVERLVDVETTQLGEGPHWDAETQSLYYLDIFGKSIHRYVPATRQHTKAVIGTMGASTELGHIQNNKGSLYSFQNGQVKKHLGDIGASNGLAWDEQRKKMYHIDTYKGSVYGYDFDEKNESIANGKSIFTLEKNGVQGMPDGMTIDTDGNLWVAIFKGYRVIKIDPRKPDTLLESVPIPAKQVTSVAFGGPKLDELYVTTAKFPIGGEIFSAPEHGGIYTITGLNAKGYPGISVVL